MQRRRDKRKWVFALGAFVAVILFSFLVAKFKTLDEDAPQVRCPPFPYTSR